ncbi:type-2 vomeronasal receptor [Crotalus adamanteus]|uniref:Type-2 vomeronasal receptor n=1 Tax=Crotalus adamanteus TaxID=8729 RepID=A0AAW1AZU6_CROAD
MLINEVISVTKLYQYILALVFAIKEINRNPELLLNITLSFHILNYFIERITYKATLSLLSTQQKFVPNFACDLQKRFIAAIGGSFTFSYYAFQLTYGIFYPVHGNKNIFPFLYQMAPIEIHQYTGFIQLLQHFGWNWIGILAVDDEHGDMFLQKIEPLLFHNICYAFTLRTPQKVYVDEYIQLITVELRYAHIFTDDKVKVCLVYGVPPSMQNPRISIVLASFTRWPPLGKVWIVTSHWNYESLPLQRLWDMQSFHGALSFTVHSKEPPGFLEFLHTVRPSWAKEDNFIQNFWEQAFDCPLHISSANEEKKLPCSGNEKLESLPNTLFEMNMSGHSYNIYNAVYLVVHSLHALLKSRSIYRHLMGREKLMFHNLKPWQIILPNNSFSRVKVGTLAPQAPPGKELSLNDNQILWHKSFNQVLPVSRCNDHCVLGTSRKKKEGDKFCCYDCAPCPKRQISDKITPIVRANNWSLTCILLLSLLLCFLCSFLFMGRPEKMTCLLRQMTFGIIFSVALLSVLAKTITVILAFMATKPGSRLRKWVGKGLANSIVLLGSFIQVGICTFWLSTSPPFPHTDLHSLKGEIIMECNEGSVNMFYCVLGYMGFLASVSFNIAFQARKLPSSFNEAKFITFSMLVFCSVWLSFVPTYLSTKGKYMVAVEIFSILSSSVGLLVCIFSPKCYIILVRPEMNMKEHLRRKQT